MEEVVFVVLLVAAFLLAPIVLSIVALVKISSLRQEMDQLRKRLIRVEIPAAKPVPRPAEVPVPKPEPRPGPSSEPVRPVAERPAPSVAKTPPVANKPSPPPTVVQAPLPTAPPKPRPAMEFLVGGKAAAFAGAAILVMGIAFLIGYAIQHDWIGPGLRVILGLLAGGALVGVGYGLECRGHGKYGLLARVLTGAGSALFYCVVFAAYGLYHLIGAMTCGAALFVSALAVFGLALVYQSQAVGVLGVLGAFGTPLLLGGELEKGMFPLIYVAVINLPVFLLGIRRKWQVLYNLAFVLTIVYFCAWADWIGDGETIAGLSFAVLYFVEFAGLGLLKLRCEQEVSGRRIDQIRLLVSSLLLLSAVSWVLDGAGWDQWLGLAYLLAALLHMGLAALARQLLSRFAEDILAFLGGGLLFAVLALPAQLDGEWVSLGWAMEGVVLAWFGGRVKSRTLLGAASLIGLIGIAKALCFDVFLYEQTPHPIWNIRFGIGMASCGLLGIQGWLAGRFPSEKNDVVLWRDSLWWGGIAAGMVLFSADLFWTLGVSDEWAWALISIALLAVGSVISLTVRPGMSLRLLGAVLIGLIPVQIGLFYLAILEGGWAEPWGPFLSPVPWLLLVVLGTVIFWLQPQFARQQTVGPLAGKTYGLVLTLASLVCAIMVLTLEIHRFDSEWSGPLITILWAVWALALIVFGLIRRTAPFRVFGLILFGLTTLKVLLVDSSALEGIERIAAFIGAGIFLLVLSFVYQKVSSRFLSTGGEE